MSDSAARNDEEKMPMNLRFDKALPYYIPGAGGSSVASSSISRESSFSSVDQDTAPLSRGSSFSSGSPGSTIDTDSSVSRSNSHRSTEDETLNEQRRRFRAARAQGVSSSRHAENGVTSTSIPARPSLLMQGRSSSAGSAKQCIASDGSRLSAPDALLISTPPGNSFMNFRCRSRSWNCNDAATGEEDAPSVEASSASPRKTSVVRTEKQNRTGSKESLAGRSHGENDATKRTQGPPHAGAKKQLKQIEALKKDIEELRRERDRFKCERDALELERDALLRDKEELKKELENRSSIIRHMKDHMKILPVARDDSGPKIKHRSISEIKRPMFFSEGSCPTNIQNNFTSF